MKVFYGFAQAEGMVKDSVVTVGMFDGVHKGHKTIIRHVVDFALEIGGEPTLVTFWPHPRQVLARGDANLKLINTLEEKIALLRQTGLQNLVVQPFSIEFSKLSSKDFLQRYLAKTLNAKAMVVGKNHFFGHNREGNFEQIREFANAFSVLAKQIPLKMIDEETISSAKIRDSLSVGNICMANELLGYDYFVTGSLCGEIRYGRYLFTPQQEVKLLPTPGVYDCCLSYGQQDLDCSVEIFSAPQGQIEIFVDLRHHTFLPGTIGLLKLSFLQNSGVIKQTTP